MHIQFFSPMYFFSVSQRPAVWTQPWSAHGAGIFVVFNCRLIRTCRLDLGVCGQRMYGHRLCQRQHTGTQTSTQQMLTSCYQPMSSLSVQRWPPWSLTHVRPVLGVRREPTSHPELAWWLFAEGLLSTSSHPLFTKGVNAMCQWWQMLRRWIDPASRAVAQQEDPGFELPDMIRDSWCLRISWMHERKALFYSS